VVSGAIFTTSPDVGTLPADHVRASDQGPLFALTIVGWAPKLGIESYSVPMNSGANEGLANWIWRAQRVKFGSLGSPGPWSAIRSVSRPVVTTALKLGRRN
jgi:hypothetical protein